MADFDGGVALTAGMGGIMGGIADDGNGGPSLVGTRYFATSRQPHPS